MRMVLSLASDAATTICYLAVVCAGVEMIVGGMSGARKP